MSKISDMLDEYDELGRELDAARGFNPGHGVRNASGLRLQLAVRDKMLRTRAEIVEYVEGLEKKDGIR